MRFFILYAVLSGFSLASSAFADTVSLHNGDRISGTIILLDGGRLLLKTEYAGTLSIDTQNIASLHSEQEFILKHQRGDEGWLTSLDNSSEGFLHLEQPGSEHLLPISDIHQLVPHQADKQLVSDLVWSGSLYLSADYKRKENDSDSYDLSLAQQLRHGRWRHALDLEYEYETKDDSKKTDRFTGAYGLDYFMTQSWFWTGKGKYTSDKLEDIRRQSILGTGPGFQFWDNAMGSLAAGILLNHNRYQFAHGGRETFYSATANWDYSRYFLAKTLELYYQGEAGKPFTPAVSYTLDQEVGLRYKINSWASFSLKSEWEKISSRQGDINDRRYLMGVGVSW